MKSEQMSASTVQPPRSNERLRDAMNNAGVTMGDLASAGRCNRKTAERWLYEGRTPHRDRATAVATRLGVPVEWLWPRLVGKVDPAPAPVQIVLPLDEVNAAVVDVDGSPCLCLRTAVAAVTIRPEASSWGGKPDAGSLTAAIALTRGIVSYRDALRRRLAITPGMSDRCAD